MANGRMYVPPLAIRCPIPDENQVERAKEFADMCIVTKPDRHVTSTREVPREERWNAWYEGKIVEIAIANVFGLEVDFSYREFGDIGDFILPNGEKISVKSRMMRDWHKLGDYTAQLKSKQAMKEQWGLLVWIRNTNPNSGMPILDLSQIAMVAWTDRQNFIDHATRPYEVDNKFTIVEEKKGTRWALAIEDMYTMDCFEEYVLGR